ncbi:diguanylate cyclase [Deinococcus cavernae]|uniref:Diguanylate cyclase n=1 Tax=Deinococcus cavernae TaxID=2320857 RepID=A0A418VAT0_9DEIO|nr:diguanylate cyclase [Deinococcus cavernae]RJF73177.1 diguanylate cyclase [Deinococcus cavernae]
MKVRQLILLWQLPFWLLLLGSALLLNSALEGRVTATRQATQTRMRTEELAGVLQAVVDMETGVRGYVIVGDEAFLEPYRAAQASLPQRFERLKEPNRPTTRTEVLRLEALLKRWQIEVADPEITARRAGQEAEARRLVQRGTGKRLIDQVRAQIQVLNRSEVQHLRADETRAARQLQHLRRALLAAGLLLLAGSVAATVVLASRLTRAFQALALAAQRLSAGEPDVRVAPSGVQEFQQIGAAFNTMSAELQQSQALAQSRQVDLEQRNTQMRSLSELSDWLQAARSLNEGAEVLGRALPALLPDTQGTLLMFNASRNLLTPLVAWGLPEGAARASSPDECWALRRGEARFPDEGRFAPPCLSSGLPGNREYMCFPLFVHGETLGVLRFQGAGAAPPLLFADKTELRHLLVPLTRQLGLALSALQLQDRLRDQSRRDPLTGLANRRHLEEELDRQVSLSVSTASPLSLVALDIDHFKRLNDTFGHDAGDAVLVQMGQTLRKLTPAGALAARPGGEEFCLLLPGFTGDEALALAEQVRAAIEEWTLLHAGISLGRITASLGVSSWGEAAPSAGVLVKAADEALYAAKRAGRNRVVLAGTRLDEPRATTTVPLS